MARNGVTACDTVVDDMVGPLSINNLCGLYMNASMYGRFSLDYLERCHQRVIAAMLVVGI